MKYENKKTTEIIFPIGGIGSGCVGLAGNGRLIDWEIFNRPNKNSENYYTHFAVKAAVGGKTLDARVLHGDWQGSFMGPHLRAGYLGYGWGPNTYTLAGMPHFRNTVFDGEFPIAKIYFSDEHFPGNVTLTAFNPYIPLNARDSSIPGAFFEIEFENLSGQTIDYTAAFSCKNPLGNKALNRLVQKEGMTSIYMYQEEFPFITRTLPSQPTLKTFPGRRRGTEPAGRTTSSPTGRTSTRTRSSKTDRIRPTISRTAAVTTAR